MINFKIAETETYSKKVNSAKYSHLYKKIYDEVYPMLRGNPFFGVHIKKLKGKFKDIYRFRIGNYRLFYKIEEKEALIFLIDIEDRQSAYK